MESVELPGHLVHSYKVKSYIVKGATHAKHVVVPDLINGLSAGQRVRVPCYVIWK